MLAGAAQHDDLDVVVVAGLAERGVQGIGHARVLRVVILGAVHGDQGQRPLDLVLHHLLFDLFVVHLRGLSGSWPGRVRPAGCP
ncbi:hypothetical protein D3C80_1997280 [compost metagenome]